MSVFWAVLVLLNCSPRLKIWFTMVSRYLYNLYVLEWSYKTTEFGCKLQRAFKMFSTLHFLFYKLSSFFINLFSVENWGTFLKYLFNTDSLDCKSLSETNITLSSSNWITSQFNKLILNNFQKIVKIYLNKDGCKNWTFWDATINWTWIWHFFINCNYLRSFK